MTISLMQFEKDYYSLAVMSGKYEAGVPLDEGGKRKEIADKLSELAKDAFFSLKNAKLVKGKPSKYWQVTEQIFKSNNTQNMMG